MEDLDYLRWYTGDVRNRNEAGYLVSNIGNLGDKRSETIYKIVNMFLYPEMKNEYERTKIDDNYLAEISNINDVLRIYDSLIKLSKYVENYNEKLYRIDRNSTVLLVDKIGYNPSNFSSSKMNSNNTFLAKSNPRLLELNIKSAFIVDVGELLKNEYIKCVEREVIILPFHNFYQEEKGLYCIQFNEKIINEFSNLEIKDIKECICKKENVENVNYIIKKLNNREELNDDKIKKYIDWKNNIRRYVGIKLYEKYEQRNQK